MYYDGIVVTMAFTIQRQSCGLFPSRYIRPQCHYCVSVREYLCGCAVCEIMRLDTMQAPDFLCKMGSKSF